MDWLIDWCLYCTLFCQCCQFICQLNQLIKQAFLRNKLLSVCKWPLAFGIPIVSIPHAFRFPVQRTPLPLEFRKAIRTMIWIFSGIAQWIHTYGVQKLVFFNNRLNSICLEKELVLKYFPSRLVPFDIPRKCQFIFGGRSRFFKETLLALGSLKDDFNSNKSPFPRRFRKSGFCCISYQYALLVDCFG